MKIYCENFKSPSEVYECNKAKAIADIRKYYNCSELEAVHMLLDSDTDNPITLPTGEEMWIELS